ncbi:bifunctional glutamate N-acetyltransferase/amino-acid acetyltransferase ArgJ [Ktedonospora formicarum]|uniref:Arginine biosynthesis bifunctional protein ArgJ n=1 Tax=Ktedonospora formicarum TaxID=2778364 RepID=A0A8J3HY69_9CHLR|nr:bifunctional glutamate N-acetyltransferase/amino-acid acetyltransferase ArgJ [Ktedonospora formicarum]GHO45366.1 arginine biosynthesis bifunctional protein ArgJ [Ktedonospora formicarum]
MADLFHEIDQCVTAPKGFRTGTTSCGIKSDAGIKDLAILVSDVPCTVAGVFTTHNLRAAPVLLCQERLKGGKAQAIVVNSGNANCATGQQGLDNAYQMTSFTASKLGIAEDLVFCSSTGIIGRQLPMEKIEAGIQQIELSTTDGNAFAEAIMTTDTHPKRMALEFEIEGKTVRLGGVTKGSGMIRPNMATMLSYITTDAAVEQAWLQQVLKEAVDDSYNMISVDGDMSTNDTCMVFANGLVDNTPLNAQHPDAPTFVQALRQITFKLAREMARDGEGATKIQTINVRGARNKADAVKAARSLTYSPLWQCALAGGDPNWGRIAAAAGSSGCEFDQNAFDIFVGETQITRQGIAIDYDQDQAHAAMAGDEVIITIDLHLGDGEATAWGCDLTHGYIDENSLYTR